MNNIFFYFTLNFNFILQQLSDKQKTGRLMLLIIPCGQPIKVKVSSLKKLRKVAEVNWATILKLNHLKENDRLLLKFSPTMSDGLQKSE